MRPGSINDIIINAEGLTLTLDSMHGPLLRDTIERIHLRAKLNDRGMIVRLQYRPTKYNNEGEPIGYEDQPVIVRLTITEE